jgi:DNA invertase Pin-like site-specific DNA recombinase
MQKQSGKTSALYYRVASKQMDGWFFDNQINALLCYANEHGLDRFKLYADIGISGTTLDRPALNKLKADIEARCVGKLIVYDISRIARGVLPYVEFIMWAQARGVEVFSIIDGIFAEPHCANIAKLYRSPLKGGVRG